MLELKKDPLTLSQIPQIEKEMKKHLCYSLFSNRIRQTDTNRFNFFLVNPHDKNNTQFRPVIEDKYWNICENIKTHRENTITFVEYTVNDRKWKFRRRVGSIGWMEILVKYDLHKITASLE